MTSEKFAYQDDYWMVGVSESHLDFVRKYIRNQEHHHNNVTFDEEFAYQDDYWMVGVSESHLDFVRKYIRNQEHHHNNVTFDG